MYWDAAQHWLAGISLVRSLTDAVLRRRARRHAAELDRLQVAHTQAHILRRLLRQGQCTTFGLAHDFQRIRTPDDFRRLVPLSRSATPASSSPEAPELLTAWCKAAWTALSLTALARPRAPLFRGQVLVLDDPRGLPADACLQQLPPLLRPFFFSLPSPGTVEQVTRLPVTCVVGHTGRLLELFAELRRFSGRERMLDIWPDLTAVIQADTRPDPDLRVVAPEPILVLRALAGPEGPLAVEDPRHGLLRLLPDHGVYFEFIPVEELDQPRPVRHGIAEVEPGLPYEMALSTPAGLWASLAGITVRFEKRDPPLLHLLEPAASAPVWHAPIRTDAAAAPSPLPAPHPRSNGTTAGRREMHDHTLSSARAGRG